MSIASVVEAQGDIPGTFLGCPHDNMATLSDFLEAWGQRMYHTRNNLEYSSKVVPGEMETAWGWVVTIL